MRADAALGRASIRRDDSAPAAALVDESGPPNVTTTPADPGPGWIARALGSPPTPIVPTDGNEKIEPARPREIEKEKEVMTETATDGTTQTEKKRARRKRGSRRGAALRGKPSTVPREIRTCQCGFKSDWPPAFGSHLKGLGHTERGAADKANAEAWSKARRGRRAETGKEKEPSTREVIVALDREGETTKTLARTLSSRSSDSPGLDVLGECDRLIGGIPRDLQKAAVAWLVARYGS